MPFDVFISYSSQDKPTADAACAKLESLGIRCWIAPRDIMPGKEYGAAIVEAIEQSRLVVLVFSSHANQSPQIRREVERAVSSGHPIIPLRIEDITPTESLEYFIGSVHWLDALTPPMEAHLARLAQAVDALLHLEAPRPNGLAAAALAAPKQAPGALPFFAGKARWPRRNAVALGIAAGGLVLAAIAGIWYLNSMRTANAAECERLWIARNSFYKSHGYCFQTERAKEHFGNTGCSYNDQDYVYQKLFSDQERAKVQDIRNTERAHGCG